MRNLLQQLENNEAVLMLYLSGELPPEDHVEVEQQLASDVNLRRELEALKGLQSEFTFALSEADRQSMPPILQSLKQAAAVKRVSRAFVKFQLERPQIASSQDSPVFVRSLRLPSWSYPFATAAMILIGWVAYWGFSSGGPPRHGIPEVAEVEIHRGSVDDEEAYPPVIVDESGHHRVLLPTLGLDEGDVNLVAISAGSYDVSSMFQPVGE